MKYGEFGIGCSLRATFEYIFHIQTRDVIFLFLVTVFPFSVDLKPFTIIGKCVAKANFHY